MQWTFRKIINKETTARLFRLIWFAESSTQSIEHLLRELPFLSSFRLCCACKLMQSIKLHRCAWNCNDVIEWSPSWPGYPVVSPTMLIRIVYAVAVAIAHPKFSQSKFKTALRFKKNSQTIKSHSLSRSHLKLASNSKEKPQMDSSDSTPT